MVPAEQYLNLTAIDIIKTDFIIVNINEISYRAKALGK